MSHACRIRRTAKLLLLGLLGATRAGAGDLPVGDWLEARRADAERILAAATADHSAWQRLAELTDRFGPRLSGSPQLEAALRWGADAMRREGFENVRLEPVQVPHWVRGRESAVLIEPDGGPLAMLGLGNSIGTRPEGLVAEVLVVGSFEEMEARAADVGGRIVLFNVPFTGYGETVRYRGQGPSRAAALGAVGVLIRSVGPIGLRTPHTGSTRYDDAQPRIPAAALAAEDANRLQRLQDAGTRPLVRLTMEARFLPDATSHNLIAEIVGREEPDEIVVLGGHIDSWDPGTGAMDDGGGCVATWQALRVLKALGLRPRRTLRLVWWTNEENGLRGGIDYLKRNTDALDRHVAALESDSGVFRPTGFGFSGADSARRIVERIASLLAPIGADTVGASGGGADIGPIVEAGRLPALSLEVDGPYFTYHHTPADTVERLDPDDVARCVAAIAVMAYVLADLPEPLERSPLPGA
jgi:carboxypeptidase Q